VQTVKELELQKKIIEALEAHKDTAALVQELKELRADIAAKNELKELQKVADDRKELKDKAAKVIKKVDKQSKAIDAFLKARDELLKNLEPLLEPMKELAKMQAAAYERIPGECYLFNDFIQFAEHVRGIPSDYLPDNFGCNFLSLKGGQVDAMGKAAEAQQYFLAAYGILAAFEKGLSKLPLREAEGLMAIEKKKGTSEKKK